MSSLVLNATARGFFAVMLVGSLWVLLRGHNEPGGGFIGGLMGAAAFAVISLSMGVEAARRLLRVHPVILMGAGLVAACISGIPGLAMDRSFLAHQWLQINLGVGTLKLGTTLLFDLGVYLVVVGGVLAFMFRLYQEEPA